MSKPRTLPASMVGCSKLVRGPGSFLRPSNLLTYVSVAAGLLAMSMDPTAHARDRVGMCLAAAALADLFDGRFARLFPRDEADKKFGVQIDSLADALSFGAAPVVALARLGAASEGLARDVWAIAALFYVVCALTRLAYYNIADDSAGFIGCPTTVIGLVWSCVLFVAPGPWTIAPLFLLGSAMVAPVRVPRPGIPAFASLVVLSLALIVGHALVTARR